MEKKTSESDKNKLVFFLGGHDAEMVTIYDLLLEYHVPKENINDKNLEWGAKLSEYKKEISNLSENQIPVCVELNLDIEYPQTAIIVDHHNARAGKDKKTSIEQVADLLNIELNRWQQLISANDKGYIWGMQEFGATEEEIQKLREFDRKCQGVTAEDEENAKISVENFLTRISNDCVIIDSQTEKTSAAIDIVYKFYSHIFILTPSYKLSYIGNQQIIEVLEKHYSELKKKDNNIETWFGGYLPDHGYFGSNKELTKTAIIKIMEPYIEMERIHSQHIFMFPFNINHDDIKDSTSSFERLIKIHKKLSSKESKWIYKPFTLSSGKNYSNNPAHMKQEQVKYSASEIWAYNEYKYFHEYVRDTIFNKRDKDKLFEDPDDQPISIYYERDVLPSDEMVIFVRAGEEILNYSLKVEHLSLRILETGIGILAITLYNYQQSDIDSILKINDYGRRIFPEFLGEQFETTEDPITAIKNTFLPEKIVFKASGIDEIDTFETKEFISIKKRHFAKYLEELLKPFEIYDDKKDLMLITPVIDDRMFVVCWHENKELMDRLIVDQSENRITNEVINYRQNSVKDYPYETSDKWYQYAFLDGNFPLVQNRKMKKELINQVTYARFIDRGTLYAITRYSFVCLCGIDSDKDFPYRILRNHMQKMYYQMSVLLLAQRASIIKFNKELETISEDADRLIGGNKIFPKRKNKKEINLENIINRAERLNKDIILFSNRIWFDEVSPQEQGIELYKLALKNLDIENQYNSLKIKVNQLYDFIRIRLEHQKTANIERLTVISLIFAVLVCILTFWAIDFSFLKYWKGLNNEYEFGRMIKSWIMFLSSAIVSVSSTLIWFHRKKYITLKRMKNPVMWLLVISILVFLVLIL